LGNCNDLTYAAARHTHKLWQRMHKSRHPKQYERLLIALRQARKEAGLTQTQVATKFGSHASFVSKIESGERRIDVVELADFCRVYGVPLATFLGRVGLA
jgi:ribosome-binding protein aMBF1 (putative translation factor)